MLAEEEGIEAQELIEKAGESTMKLNIHARVGAGRAFAAFGFGMLLWSAAAPSQALGGIPIEYVQREFQGRYHFLTGQYVQWPLSPGPTGRLPSRFTPEGFYGDLDHNGAFAATLVAHLAGHFYPLAGDGFIHHFLRTTNGITGLETNSVNAPRFTLDDFPAAVPGTSAILTDPATITVANCGACLSTLQSYIERCIWVPVGVGAAHVDADTLLDGHICGEGGSGSNDWSQAVNTFYTNWDASGWIRDDFTTNQGVSTRVTSELHTNGDTVWTHYAISAGATRFKLQAWALGYPDGPYSELFSNAPMNIFLRAGMIGSGTNGTCPPVLTDTNYHLFAQTNLWQTNWLSASIGETMPTVSCPTSAPADVWNGWFVWGGGIGGGNMAYAAVKPKFRTDPDVLPCEECGGCLSCEDRNRPGQICFANHSADLQISLGPLRYRRTPGYLYLNVFQPGPGETPADTTNLVAVMPSGGYANVNTVIEGGSGGFTIKIYDVQNNSLLCQDTVMNAGAGGQVAMAVTEQVGSSGLIRSNRFGYDAGSGTWVLTHGTGGRSEYRTTVWDADQNGRTDTIAVKDAAGSTVTERIERYERYPRGFMMTMLVLGSGSGAKTNFWTYESSGQVETMLRDTGYWETYQYDDYGRLRKKVSQLGDTSFASADTLNRVLAITFDDTNGVITTLETAAGSVASLTFELHAITNNLHFTFERIQTIRCTAPDGSIDSSGNLTNVVWRPISGYAYHVDAWDVLAELRPDGTLTLRSNTLDGVFTTCVGVPSPGWTWSEMLNTDWTEGPDVADGTLTTTVVGTWGELLSESVEDVGSQKLLDYRTCTDYDPMRRGHTTHYLDGTTETSQYDCCGLSTTTDRDGVVTHYSNDDARRQVATLRNGITLTNVLDAEGRALQALRIGSNGPPVLLHGAAYDTAGRLIRETNALNGVTYHAESKDASGHTIMTDTYPDTGVRTTVYHQDGTVLCVSNTAAFPLQYEYGQGSGFTYTKETKLAADGTGLEWTKTYRDMVGRSYLTLYNSASGAPGSTNFYNALGQLTHQVDPDGVSMLYAYTPRGELAFSVLDSNRNALIDFDGNDRITMVTDDVDYQWDTGIRRRSFTYVWKGADENPTLLSMTETPIGGTNSWTVSYFGNLTLTNLTATKYAGNGYRYVTNVAPDGSFALSTYYQGRLIQQVLKNPAGDPLSTTSFGYDDHGRQSTVTDGRTGTVTTTFYNNADQVSGTVVVASGLSPQVTTNYFDNMGRVWKTTLADGTSVMNQYELHGLLSGASGSRTYPVGYTYDAQGRLLTLTTWTDYAGGTGAATTTNGYDPYRGWLKFKTYADGKGTTYTYKPSGRLEMRIWARGTNTTYSYNAAWDLSLVSHNDSTPGVTFGYDRLGRLGSIVSAGMTTTRVYDDAGDLLCETNSGGVLSGLSITNGYDQFLRRTNMSVLSGASVLSLSVFTYDSASRMHSAGDGANTATYSYLANSPLIQNIYFTNNGVQRMVTTKNYDNLNRLTSISSVPSASSAVSFNYGYNNANQRTSVVKSSDSYDSTWLYGYDSLGQVTNAVSRWGDGTFVEGQQFAYSFDDIGNRKWAKTGGDSAGQNLRTSYYAANNRNEYTSRTVPGYLDLTGLAAATNAVTVNDSAANRYGQYFRKELTVDNGSGPVWQGVTVTAPSETNVTGNVYLAPTNEVFGYDYDGNLTNDGRWTYTWDAENRPVTMYTNVAIGVPSEANLKIDFTYDVAGRRIQKVVSAWSGGAYVPQSTNRFVYDGWNLVAEVTPASAPIRRYVWGLDLSGSEQGAGGVGGLVALCYQSTQTTNAFAAFDGNGNVVGLVNVADGAVIAQFEFGPFGELVRASGSMAGFVPMRFSTKYQDGETDLLYYGYRYYKCGTGSWVSRDPIGESGGRNLYALVGNCPVFGVDSFGLADTLQPGGYAGESIPADGPGRNFKPDQRTKVNEIGEEDGCHTCGGGSPGTKTGNWVPDHQPPSALAKPGQPQRLYPQCLPCSQKQGGEVVAALRARQGAKGAAGAAAIILLEAAANAMGRAIDNINAKKFQAAYAMCQQKANAAGLNEGCGCCIIGTVKRWSKPATPPNWFDRLVGMKWARGPSGTSTIGSVTGTFYSQPCAEVVEQDVLLDWSSTYESQRIPF
jgi:RHS repeat-associated protein